MNSLPMGYVVLIDTLIVVIVLAVVIWFVRAVNSINRSARTCAKELQSLRKFMVRREGWDSDE